MRAHRITRFGGPEVLGLVTVPDPVPGPGEVLLAHERVGVNYVDTQHRAGRPYPVDLPLTVGIEGVGRVAGLGEPGLTDAAGAAIRVGDRVAYGGIMPGGYAELASIPADQVVPVPDGLCPDGAASALVRGRTAHMLAVSVAPPPSREDGDPGDETVVVLAAAGGTGSLLVQLLVRQGRRVVGVTSGARRCAYVAGLGVHRVVDRLAEDVPDAVRRVRPGGVDVVFDSVGRATFDASRRMLRPRGHLVCFGQSSGPVAPVDPAVLSGISPAGGPGSLRLTWPTLDDHDADPGARHARSTEVLRMAAAGTLRPHVDDVVPLADAAAAHRRLESGDVLGCLVLAVDPPASGPGPASTRRHG